MQCFGKLQFGRIQPAGIICSNPKPVCTHVILDLFVYFQIEHVLSYRPWLQVEVSSAWLASSQTSAERAGNMIGWVDQVCVCMCVSRAWGQSKQEDIKNKKKTKTNNNYKKEKWGSGGRQRTSLSRVRGQVAAWAVCLDFPRWRLRLVRRVSTSTSALSSWSTEAIFFFMQTVTFTLLICRNTRRDQNFTLAIFHTRWKIRLSVSNLFRIDCPINIIISYKYWMKMWDSPPIATFLSYL